VDALVIIYHTLSFTTLVVYLWNKSQIITTTETPI